LSYHHPQPEKIELTADEFNEIESEIKSSNLRPKTKEMLTKSLHFMVWLQGSLEHAKLSIKKLQKLFGIIPRIRKKHRKNKGDNDNQSSADKDQKDDEGGTGTTADETTASTDTVSPKKRSGRIPRSKYKNVKEIAISHTDLKPGDLCPTLCGGKLYRLKPSAILKIDGASFAYPINYSIERLRCALCGDIQKPDHDISKVKYTDRFISQLIMHKYYLALPMYRMDNYQRIIGVPLPDSTQWRLFNSSYHKLLPAFTELERHAATSSLFHYDDTRVRILSVIKDNKLNPDKKRTGQYTTVVIANSKQGSITLFYSSISHAGENMQALLARRPEGLGSFTTMCDALGANTLDIKGLIESNCLAHALVKFIDLESISPYDLSRPINDLTKVFENDEKTQGMSDHDRLKYHQNHSKPILDKLKKWMQEQLDHNIVEPSGHFGKVLKYCLKHWHKLTRFLTVAGCPISNNKAERMLKIIIRLRKSSMFHKTEHGAEVCATLLSLIQTAIDHDLNPVDYLNDLLQNADLIIKEPSRWMPWSIQGTLEQMKEAA
jgi:transposase